MSDIPRKLTWLYTYTFCDNARMSPTLESI